MVVLALEDMHDLADPVDAAPGILGLVVPNPPAQPLDSGTITVFACIRPGSSVDNPIAACFACWSRMAIWNQSAIGGFVTPASARIDRRPGQPSVNAVSSVSSVPPTVSRFRRISTARSVSVLATAPNTCRPPAAVSTLPTRTLHGAMTVKPFRVYGMRQSLLCVVYGTIRGEPCLGRGRATTLHSVTPAGLEP